MRLYPPAWFISRKAKEEDEIWGYRIPARSTVAVSPRVTHRHPACWENPDAFVMDLGVSEEVEPALEQLGHLHLGLPAPATASSPGRAGPAPAARP